MSKMKTVKDYKILDLIGKGSFAKVYKVQKDNGEEYALKEIKETNSEFEKYIQGELDIINQKLKHRNVIKIYEYFIDKNIYIAMEYSELGDLNDYMVQEKPELGQRLAFMIDMAMGVNYLHTQNIIHRDLKPENILLTKVLDQIICKITDFGVSRIKLSKYDKFRTYIGSYPYMAPEITGEKDYSNEVDTFALGLLYYAVYKYSVLTNSFGKKALIPGIVIMSEGKPRIAYLNEVLKREQPTQQQFIDKYFTESSAIGSFIYSMIDIEPQNRPEMDFILVKTSEIRTKYERLHDLQRHEESIKDLQQQNKVLRNEITHLKEASDLEVSILRQEMERKISMKDSTIEDLQKQCDVIGAELLQKDSVNSNLEKKCEDLKEQHQIGQTTIRKITSVLETVQNQNVIQVKQLKVSHETYQNDRAKWQQKVKELETAISDLQQKLLVKQEGLNAVHKHHNVVIQQHIEKRDLVTKKLEEQIKNLQQENEEKDKKIVTLTEEIIEKEGKIVSVLEVSKKNNQTILSLKDEIITAQKKHQNECQQHERMMKENEIIVARFQDEQKQTKSDMDQKEATISDCHQLINSLYQQIEELQLVLQQYSMQELASAARTSERKDEGDVVKEEVERECNLLATQKKIPDKQVLSGDQHSTEQVVLNTLQAHDGDRHREAGLLDGEKVQQGSVMKPRERLLPAELRLDLQRANPELGSNSTLLTLPDGTVLVSNIKNNQNHVTRLSDTGATINTIININDAIQGFIFSPPDDVFILQLNGTITQVKWLDGQIVKTYKVQVEGLLSGLKTEESMFLLVDYRGGELLTFNTTNGHQQCIIQGLKYPTSVARTVQDGEVVYILCEAGAYTVRIYNSNWTLLRSVGGKKGSADGELNRPNTVIVLPCNNILVSDRNNDRVCEFTLDGQFVRHVMTDIDNPRNLQLSYPLLWVTYGKARPYRVKCFQLYK